MNSTYHANQATVASGKTNKSSLSITSDFWKQIEFNRFGIICVLLIVVACVGGIAAATAIRVSTEQLVLVAIPVMAVEALILAVAPMKYISWASLISVIISLIIIIL